jgi:hypothetical protein
MHRMSSRHPGPYGKTRSNYTKRQAVDCDRAGAQTEEARWQPRIAAPNGNSSPVYLPRFY